MDGKRGHETRQFALRTIDRREFLRAAAGGALAVSGMFGCGGGGGGGSTGSGLLSGADRQAVLDAIDNKIATMSSPDADIRRQEIVSMLQARPEIQRAGSSSDGCVWGHFKDKTYLMIIANRELPTAADVPPIGRGISRSAPAEIPARTQARLLCGMDNSIANIIPGLQTMLTSHQYQLAPDAGTGTIYDLKRVAGDGVFYLGAHGGVMPDINLRDMYGVTSSTPFTPNMDVTLFDDFLKGRIILAPITDPHFTQRTVQFYAVTSEWVKKYWFFGPESLVYIDACSSASPEAATFIAECFKSQAGVYAGWTLPAPAGRQNYAAAYAFDRLTGANSFFPETPDQRPFDYASIKSDMGHHTPRIDTVPLSGNRVSELVFLKGTLGESGVLNPTIKYVDMDELNNKLIITGKFGARPSGTEAKVTVGGYDRPILSWDKEKIEVDMPQKGNGSSGEVTVFNRDRFSNPRTLTEWRGRFSAYFTSAPYEWDGTFDMHFRADIQSYRDDAGETPKYRTVQFNQALDSKGTLKASGQSGNSKWRGTATLTLANTPNYDSKNMLACFGEFTPETKTLRMAFYFTSIGGGLEIYDTKLQSKVGDIPAVGGFDDGPLSDAKPVPAIYMTMDANFGINGDTRQTPKVGPGIVLVWPSIDAVSPPDPNGVRSIKMKGR